MVDLVRLRDMIDNSGMTMTEVAIRAKISLATLSNRLRGRGEFHASEIVPLAEALNMTVEEREEIFLR